MYQRRTETSNPSAQNAPIASAGATDGAVPSTISALISRLKRAFATPKQVPYLRNIAPTGSTPIPDGNGWLVPGVSVAQNTSTTITYTFGRLPVFVRLLDNGTTAQTRLQVTARSANSVSITPLDAALTSALIEIR